MTGQPQPDGANGNNGGDDGYEVIEAAIMAAPRGRAFLAEFARRNRTADTALLIEAIERLQQTATGAGADAGARLDLLHHELEEMRLSIEETRRDIADIKPREELTGRFAAGGQDAEATAEAAGRATADILAAAERLQDIADKLRRGGADADLCDEIDIHASGIFMASSFQDMTGKRIGRLVAALRHLEQRVGAMLALWPERNGPSAAG